MEGVVTYVPHTGICTRSVFTTCTLRYRPAPGYQREAPLIVFKLHEQVVVAWMHGVSDIHIERVVAIGHCATSLPLTFTRALLMAPSKTSTMLRPAVSGTLKTVRYVPLPYEGKAARTAGFSVLSVSPFCSNGHSLKVVCPVERPIDGPVVGERVLAATLW